MINISPRSYPDTSTPVIYRDTVVVINTSWNVREQAWYLSISDSVGNPLISSFKMLQTQNVTARNTLPYFDLFDVYVINDKHAQSRPTFEDMGQTLRIAFIDKEETEILKTELPNSGIYK